MELKGWGMTNLLPTCAKMADCLHYLRSVRFFHADNIDNPDLIKALEIGEKVHADLLALSGDDWVSVDYELPKQEQIVRAYNPRWREKYNYMAFIFLNGNFITYPYMYKVVQPTHWQPFSLLPKE